MIFSFVVLDIHLEIAKLAHGALFFVLADLAVGDELTAQHARQSLLLYNVACPLLDPTDGIARDIVTGEVVFASRNARLDGEAVMRVVHESGDEV